jgi:outer membrane protein assembly factor BamB
LVLTALVAGLACPADGQPAPRSRPSATPRSGGAQAPLDRHVFPFFPLQPLWTTDTGVAPAASGATDGVRLFVPFASGEMNVFALATGASLFSRRVASTKPPVVADGRLLVTGDRFIDALTLEDASPLWKAPLPAAAAFPPVGRGGWVFVALADGSLKGLRGDSGAVVWTAPVGEAVAAPVIEGDRLYAAVKGRAVQALAVPDGAAVWRVALDSDATAITAVAGHVFVATSGRWLYALDSANGRVRWRFRIQGAAIGLAVDEDRVIAVMLDQAVRAFNIGSGAQAWRQELSFRPAGGPVITGQSVLVTGFAPSVRVIDRKTGADQGSYAIPLPTDASGISLETLAAGPLVATGATLFDDVVVLMTQHGALHGARRAFGPTLSAITAMPGTVLTVPAAPPGMPETPDPAAAPKTDPVPTPATTPAARPANPAAPPAGGTPPRTPPAPPGR